MHVVIDVCLTVISIHSSPDAAECSSLSCDAMDEEAALKVSRKTPMRSSAKSPSVS